MNITPQNYNLPIQTAVNLQTDSLRRDNQQREVIAKPEASNQSAAEKGVASDKERGRTPAQNNEQVDFAALRKQAEQAADSIGDNADRNPEQEDTQQKDNGAADGAESQESAEKSEKSNAEAFVEQKTIKGLQKRDQEVRSHELAHATVGGAYTGAPSYTFQVGPDGKKYAVAGEVSVDVSPIDGDPRATIAKMQKVHAAALAPANPSTQDTRVAASAAKLITQAQSELSATAFENPNLKKDSVGVTKSNDVFAADGESNDNEKSKEFDQFLDQTLSAQEETVPSRSVAVDKRAGRIEEFYSTINHAYEKPASHQFELTA